MKKGEIRFEIDTQNKCILNQEDNKKENNEE